MTGWTFADVWEEVAAAAPDAPAQIRGQRVISWRDFDRRANALAAHMLQAGLDHQAKVAAYLYNAPEYLEAYYAAFKAGLVPVNTNYRYETEELFYLFDNADAEAIVFHAGFAPRLEAIRDRLTKVKCWVAVADQGAPIPDWAVEYESVVAPGADRVAGPWGRSGDDLLLLYTGGCIVTLPSLRFDAEELFDEVHRLRASSIAIVGQAFAAPMLDALEANPGRWDLRCIIRIGSSGTVWSQENKHGLLRHLPPGAMLADSLGSSEAVGLGVSTSVAGAEASTAQFMVGPNSAVFNEAGERLAPGGGERGMVAVGGFIPVGYYKDPAKTAKTFHTYEGRRWSVPGDFAEVNADGSIKLLGRGSQVVNTGGEKVFPEEVEEALKTHPAVRDAVVVGVPDARFGERICAVVDPRGGETPTLAELAEHVRGRLAAYKAPRELVLAPVIRAANGKVDYKGVRAQALAALGVTVG